MAELFRLNRRATISQADAKGKIYQIAEAACWHRVNYFVVAFISATSVTQYTARIVDFYGKANVGEQLITKLLALPLLVPFPLDSRSQSR